jgi:pyruvate kinase
MAGISNIHNIARCSDIICIDRVDLINEIKDIKSYLAYEDIIIKTTKTYNKQIFIASDILPSIIKEKKPVEQLLPEMIQLKYYNEKGVDAVILAEETAVGFYPYHTIDIAKSIVKKKLKVHFSTKMTEVSNGQKV